MVWNQEAYDFLKQQAVADTVHPSLWLNGKANIEAGIYEVLPGKIYQVRGFDEANLTFVRSKTGWIVIDVTTNTEAASYGLRITEEVLEENMLFALEPKFVLPGIGAVGIENTYLVTSGGCEKLTLLPEEIINLI